VTPAARTTSFSANVPDGVFIAPAGLAPRILIGKHKIEIAAWHASSRTKVGSGSDVATRPARAYLDVVTHALTLNAQ
jgi:hypothetical protein